MRRGRDLKTCIESRLISTAAVRRQSVFFYCPGLLFRHNGQSSHIGDIHGEALSFFPSLPFRICPAVAGHHFTIALKNETSFHEKKLQSHNCYDYELFCAAAATEQIL